MGNEIYALLMAVLFVMLLILLSWDVIELKKDKNSKKVEIISVTLVIVLLLMVALGYKEKNPAINNLTMMLVFLK